MARISKHLTREGPGSVDTTQMSRHQQRTRAAYYVLVLKQEGYGREVIEALVRARYPKAFAKRGS